MKIIRTFLCVSLICFVVLTPKALYNGVQNTFVDARFVRQSNRYTGSIVLYHIVRHRPYAGSLTQWLKARAEAYEKKHKGTYIEIEGMDEQHFYERIENGRIPDAYSFFSGTLYADRLQTIGDLLFPYRSGLFQTDRCVPYCYSGYCKLVKTPDNAQKTYYANDILAARANRKAETSTEDRADILYLDMRRAGDLIRYRDGFALASVEPIDCFTDAVCWFGIDRGTDAAKAEVLIDFLSFLMEPESQQSLNALGLFSVRADIKNTPPDPILKQVFRIYDSVSTVDPFEWNAMYDALKEDAALSCAGDDEAHERFTIRLRECLR